MRQLWQVHIKCWDCEAQIIDRMRAILAGKIVSAWGIPDPCSPWNKVFLLVPWNRSFGNPGCSGSETLCGDGILSEERRNRGNTPFGYSFSGYKQAFAFRRPGIVSPQSRATSMLIVLTIHNNEKGANSRDMAGADFSSVL